MLKVELIPQGREKYMAILHQEGRASRLLFTGSVNPEPQAARVLYEEGFRGKFTTFRGKTPCLTIDVEKAASKLLERDGEMI